MIGKQTSTGKIQAGLRSYWMLLHVLTDVQTKGVFSVSGTQVKPDQGIKRKTKPAPYSTPPRLTSTSFSVAVHQRYLTWILRDR